MRLVSRAALLSVLAWCCWTEFRQGIEFAKARWPVGTTADPDGLLRFMLVLVCLKAAAVFAAMLAAACLLRAAFALVRRSPAPRLVDAASTESPPPHRRDHRDETGRPADPAAVGGAPQR
jgi:hypothetical protein